MTGIKWAGFALLSMTFAASQSALAHTKLVKSTPAEGTTTTGVSVVTLTFDAAITPDSGSAEIVMTGMPGMNNHSPMAIKAFVAATAPTTRTVTLKLRNRLKPGTYALRWAVEAADGHPMRGELDFEVTR